MKREEVKPAIYNTSVVLSKPQFLTDSILMLILQQLEPFFVFAANVTDINASSVGTHVDLEFKN